MDAPRHDMTKAPEDNLGGASLEPVWDIALRVFHWVLAASVIAAILLGHFGPNIMTLHFWLGYLVTGLLVFRVIWGLVGPRSARFVHFVPSPRAILAYLRHLPAREPSYWPGHNPLGALSVFAMLGVLGFQVVTGLISDPEDYVNTGPLANSVAKSTATDAVGWHHLGGNLILALIVLHIAVIVFYRVWKHENLVKAMITGRKWVRRGPGRP